MRRLPDAELEVMQAIWGCEPPVFRSAIEEKLKDTHPMAMTTLLTLLTRLADRGVLRIEKTGRRSQYIPLIPRKKYLAEQSHQFLNRLCGGSLSTLASALCDSGLSREEIRELADLLERGEL